MSDVLVETIESAIATAADQVKARLEDTRCVNFSQTVYNLSQMFVSRFPGKSPSKDTTERIDAAAFAMVIQSKSHEGSKSQAYSQAGRTLEQARSLLDVAEPKKNTNKQNNN